MGAGVNLFKQLFPNDFYPFTANTLMSAKPTSKVIKDSNNQTIQTITLSGVELRGLIKVGTNGLYADGDIDDGSGMGEVRYRIDDLSTLNWYYIESRKSYAVSFSGMANTYTSSEIPHLLCDKYEAMAWNTAATDNTKDNAIFAIPNDNMLRIRDLSFDNDVVAFKNSLSGHYLVYQTATPTTQTLTAWNNPIKACEGGTEEFTDTRTIKMPTGHDTVYGTDLIAKTADFGTTVYGGSFDFTTGELISDKNVDGTDKGTPDTYQLTPQTVPAFEGNNNVFGNTDGDTEVKYFKVG